MSNVTVKHSWVVVCLWLICCSLGQTQDVPSYKQLKQQFQSPDHARWGEVPLWWWEGEEMSRERVTWQLEQLAEKGVKAVCPIQRAPQRARPSAFSPEWWDMMEYVHDECKRLGMKLWGYDHVGYGHYEWFQKAVEKAKPLQTSKVEFFTKKGQAGETIQLELPEGDVIGAYGYPLVDGTARDKRKIDLTDHIQNNRLNWSPEKGTWRVAVSVAVPYKSSVRQKEERLEGAGSTSRFSADAPYKAFHLSSKATDAFLSLLYGKFKRLFGKEAMGTSFAGMFQDEHPFIPRNNYTDQLADVFQDKFGYEIGEAIPALHMDVGPRTPKYRTDYFDAYLSVSESTYWKRVYDWTRKNNLLTSYDNWGRTNVYKQTQRYINYFRTQRWFSAPGYDDAPGYDKHHPVSMTNRNYYDTKIASSIARLYDRPRVWVEAFHSSGWGRTPEQTLRWLSTNYAWGANLYNEHGLYYTTRGGTWEHAAPDPHWRQPYWRYYQEISDWTSRLSYLMSQGSAVTDVAVHYPATSILAGEPLETKRGGSSFDYNTYMQLSRSIYIGGMDNDIIDDASMQSARVHNGKLMVDGNGYRALVFGPEVTVRRANLQKALKLVRSGGTVLFYGHLPTASTEKGRQDAQLDRLLEQLLGTDPSRPVPSSMLSRNFDRGGFCAFVPKNPDQVVRKLSSHVQEDVNLESDKVFYSHRRVGKIDIYLFQNVSDTPTTLKARLRVDGVPEKWNLFSGSIQPVDGFTRKQDHTVIKQRLDGHTAELIVVRPGDQQSKSFEPQKSPLKTQILPDEWQFSVIPTRDNRWGAFRWPPSDRKIGPEVRSFSYHEEADVHGKKRGWHTKTFDHSDWKTYGYSSGPYWLTLGPVSDGASVRDAILEHLNHIGAGTKVTNDQGSMTWQNVVFSRKLGRREAIGDRPDGAFDPNFINLPEGHRFLFTRLRSPHDQQLGLNVQLRSDKPTLWVNGDRQPFHGTVGKLPLKKGVNTILLEIPNGGRGNVYVQSTFPDDRKYSRDRAKPRMGLSIDLPSPYLQCFRDHPDVRYDVKSPGEKRIGWYRFKIPPGTSTLRLPVEMNTRAWVDGQSVPVKGKEVRLPEPTNHPSTVALRVEMKPGSYAGAAFPEPIRLEIQEGMMPLGDWTKQGLPTYSGIGVYKQSVRLTSEEAKRSLRLRLGKVRVAAEVFVNGESAGVRIAQPFKFDLTGMVRSGKNTITIHVANTLGPHYKPLSPFPGPDASGLFGPVKLYQYGDH